MACGIQSSDGIIPPVKKFRAIQSPVPPTSKRYGCERWANTCTNSSPPGRSQRAMRRPSSRWLRTCSNISTLITRSNRPAATSSVCALMPSSPTSAVRTVTLVSPRCAARSRMCCRCVDEFETATIRAWGYRSAIHSVSEPQPQPSSRMSCPSARPARRHVSSSIASSAASSVVTLSGHQPDEYLSRGPRMSEKKAAGTS